MGLEVIAPKVRATAKTGVDYHTRPDSHKQNIVGMNNEELQRIADLITANVISTMKKVLTVDEAAKYMGISKSALYKKMMRREIPFSKPGGKVCFFNRLELEAWLMSNRQSTAAELQDSALKYCSHTRTRIGKKGGQNE
jgi:excisionase family DNA binding protein